MSESEESDIFEGLSDEKKEKIMAEVAELYEANVALQMENKMLKKRQHKFLGSQEGILDSMNMDSEEYEDEGSFIKNGSYTDNDELGNSHDNYTIGSIHNIWIDPTSESYIEGKKRELAVKKPMTVPTLDFNYLHKQEQAPSIKIKSFGVNKHLLKAGSSGKIHQFSHSNRIPDERISFTWEGEHEESATETVECISNSIEIEEKKNAILNKHHNHSHIMIKDVHDASSNLNEDSQNYGSNISKLQNSYFATSSEATKK